MRLEDIHRVEVVGRKVRMGIAATFKGMTSLCKLSGLTCQDKLANERDCWRTACFHHQQDKRRWDKLLVPCIFWGDCVTGKAENPLIPTPCWNDKP